MDIVLCVTGSVAATESIKLAREFKRQGHNVKCFMTQEATKIIHPNAMEFASREGVVLDLTGDIEHVKYAQADLILVAPATANTISKFACKIADNAVSTLLITAFGHNTPIVFVPSMHDSMYDAVYPNILKLKSEGIKFVNPRMDEGKAKFPSVEDIVLESLRTINLDKFNKGEDSNNIAGKKVLISLGGTYEAIDPIRGITNRSSGKMGLELAKQAYIRGADLSLLMAHVTVNIPKVFNVIYTESTELMNNTTMKLVPDFDIFIATAAVSDFAPIKEENFKISSDFDLTLDFKPLNKIIKHIKEVNPNIFLVGFKAEYNVSEEKMIECAHNQIDFAGTDLVVANDVGREGCEFGSDNNEVILVNDNILKFAFSSKKELSILIFNEINRLI
ncbi:MULTISPECIES: bifunctional phosphopantothenoylcysteine decarboxylase/phosphopantothenate--cysteine ligase CoaBC [unclassified Methanobrevibacter]|jgi:phosphopantothenoylcysteine decarboxylase/phosphopantothenate--cysteine ligase|uniref:bifunctional phosphopantothenoylcysteine decarboxylase/phosphopantothenate--cysteine ligase CoaBC n=1 Tax=unclassified Methanobrevibacter TaxID=2638681 RepID=UPI0039B950E3